MRSPGSISKIRTQKRLNQAKRHAWQRRFDAAFRGMFHLDPVEFVAFLRTATKWLFLGSLVGALAGAASAIFLISLAWATAFRLENPVLLLGLPLAGFAVGWVYWRFGGAAAKGNNLVIEEVNQNQSRIPLRMAPLVLAGTVITHLFGGSAGREGTAIQMGASLADTLRRVFRLNPVDRRLMIMAGISGGFGSVFGVPIAGFVFGMEVQSVGRIRYEGIIPCMVASYVGDVVTRWLGAPHSHYPPMPSVAIDPLLLLRVATAGIAFGLTSLVFIELTHGIKHLQQRLSPWTPLYPVLGGVALILLTFLVGTEDYLGLSLPLIQNSVSGKDVATFAFLLKLIFTAITLGSGYLGGEVTPLFVIGSTLGFTLGRVLGVDPAFLAAIGMVAVFAGASNTPIACAIMGIELFGAGAALYLFLGCTFAYLASGHRGIYATQVIELPKAGRSIEQPGSSLGAVRAYASGRLVRALMTTPVVAVDENTPLTRVIETARQEGVRALPVLNADKVVVGIITDNDLKRVLPHNLTQLRHTEASAPDLPAQAIMSQPVITTLHTTPLTQAIETLNTHPIKRLPVVDESGHLLGILTRSDILREIAMDNLPLNQQEMPDFNWLARVEDVSLEPAVTILAGAPRAQALATLQAEQVKRLVVINAEGQALGILTEGDLITRAPQAQTVQEIMTAPVLCTDTTALAHSALRLMMENQIKRLPVLDENRQLCGMVGRAGLMHAFLDGVRLIKK